MDRTVHGVELAMTEATLGSFVTRDISPKQCPSLRVTRCVVVVVVGGEEEREGEGEGEGEEEGGGEGS